MEKKIVVSGIQPSGALHVGNFLGMLRNALALQERKDLRCFFFIADQHALTEPPFDAKAREKLTLELMVDFLALGLNPRKVTLFLQSDVPEHVELAWTFATVTPVGELERMTQWKDKAGKDHGKGNAGLLTYPILQAADILLYKAQMVPVGQDQFQHLEFTRTVARAFNRRYGATFPEAEALATDTPKIMSLHDPVKKMSKSHGEQTVLRLTDSPKQLAEKLARAVTDSGAAGKVKSAGVANLFMLLKAYGEEATLAHFEDAYHHGTIRYSELKAELARAVGDYFAPFRKKREELLRKPNAVRAVFAAGAKSASRVARETIAEVRQRTGIGR
jgi:tryptophanyl-tRNA synthetase